MTQVQAQRIIKPRAAAAVRRHSVFGKSNHETKRPNRALSAAPALPPAQRTGAVLASFSSSGSGITVTAYHVDATGSGSGAWGWHSELTIDGLLDHPQAGHDRLTTTTSYLDTSSGSDHYGSVTTETGGIVTLEQLGVTAVTSLGNEYTNSAQFGWSSSASGTGQLAIETYAFDVDEDTVIEAGEARVDITLTFVDDAASIQAPGIIKTRAAAGVPEASAFCPDS